MITDPYDLGSGGGQRPGLGLGHRFGHVDDGVHTDQSSRGGHPQTMVSARGGDHAVGPGTTQEGVECSTELECARELELLQFQGDGTPVDLGGHDRGAASIGRDAFGGGTDVGGCGRECDGCGPGAHTLHSARTSG